MRRKFVVLTTLFALSAAVAMSLADTGLADEKPKLSKSCGLPGCHTAAQNVLRGVAGSVSGKAETIQINTGAVWTVKFNDDTKVINWSQPLNKLPKEKELAITFVEKDGSLYASTVTVKPAMKVPPEKLMKADELMKLTASDTKFLLIDARPTAKFNEGHIPGSINIFDAQFDKNLEKLPKEKDALIVYYCAGPT